MNSKQCLRQEDLSLVQPIEILIADAKVEDLHILLAGMRANVQLHLITDSDQAPCQVAKALSTPGLDTLHLLGHGSPGEVILGGWRMNLESLNDIQSVMNEDASKLQSVYSQNNNLEICLWSCRTGAGEKGKQFMNTLADMTNATIFASETLVGNQVKGGSWDLNIQSSPKNGSPFAKDSMEQYDKVLIGSSSFLGQILSGIPGPGFYSPGTWTFEIERESGYFYDVQAGVGGGLPRIKFTIGGETAYAEFTEVNLSGNLVFTYEGPLTGAIAWFSNTAVDNFDLNGSTIDIYDGSDFESANKINTIDTDVEFVPDLPDGTNLPSFVGVLMADVATIPSGGANLTDATVYALEANELVIGTDNDVVLSGQSTDWTVNVTVVRTDDGVNHLGYVFSNQDGKSVTVYGDVGSVGFREMSGQLAKLTLTYHPLDADGGLSELYGEISLPSSIARLNIDPDAAGSITVSASSTGNQTIVGAVTDSDTFDADYGLINYREDVVLLPFKYQDVSIQTASINLIGDGSNESVIQISAGGATKTLYGVEKIQFTAEGSDISELAIIGAGGYDNLSVATTQANTSHISEDAHVFISNSANTETQDIVNVNNLTLIVENGRTAGAYDLKLAEDATIQTISLEGSGTINVTGNAFDNTIYDNSATNILSGGAGDDIIYSRNGADTLSGGEGNDTFDITDTSGNDTDITDLGESDTLKVISDGDVTAEVASDWTASAATDNNADKTDVVINTNGYNVDLSAATTTTAGFTINSDAEGADGSTITGSNQADVITGNANGGTDTIDAGAGDDEITFTQATVTGSDGTDTFNVVGGSNSTNSITDLSGSDTLTVSVGGGVTAELTDNWDASAATDNNADKTDVVINTNGYNVDLSAATTTTAGFTINSDAEGADGSTITGSNQADVITGNANGGTDTIDAGAGDDEITFTQATVTGSDGTDTFNVVGGSNSTNSITDLSGSDTLTVSVGGGVTAELTDNWDASAATDNNADKTDVVINTNGYNVDLSAATTTTAGFTINSDAEGADGSTITGSNQADVITGNANGGTDTIDAGAGDDEITFTQATVTGSDGTDTFNVVGGSNSTNSITDLSGSDTLTVSVGGGVTAELTDNWDASAATDNNADKTDVVINTNGYNVDLSAATTTTAGFTINSDAEGADGSTITGSNQADVITGNANGGTDTIDAGAGDDEITFTQATVTGSDGTDTFNVVGGSNSTNSITDLSGSDTLTVSVGGGVTAELTDNWDASAATDNNADKTDVVINTNGYNVDLSAATTTTAGFTINSDAEGADGSTITGSNQADVITGNANGGTDTIDAGAGDDEITFTQATVTGSDGTDTFNVVGGSNSTNSITDLSGSDTLTVSVGGGVTAELTDNWDASAATDNNADKTDVVINTNGYNVDLSAATTTTAGFTINSDAEGADGSTITGSNQADVITGNANGGTDTIDAGAGDDEITFTQATVTGSDGTDTFNVVGGSNSTNSITDLSGSDTLTVSVGGGVTAELTDNWDASAATDNNADKTDVVINTNGYNVDLSAATTTTAGFTINSDAEGADGSTITGSNQADVITGNANGGTDTIDAGAGDDEITFTQATVTGSDGTDTFNVVGGSNSTNSITDLSGSDTLTVSVGGGVTAELTDNWDASAATDNNADKTDVVINTNGYNVDLSAATTTTAGFTINSDAEGADGSTITGSNQADVITGNANGGTDTIDAGAGDDEITFTQATVTGSDGTDTFNVVGGSNSTNSITDLSGSDTLTVSVGGGVTAELTDNWDASAATDNNADKTDVVINTNGYNVDLSAATTTTAGFTINSDAEGADGSTITGSNQADVITGNANGGTDTIDAGAGNDVIYSGSGDDTIDAGSGDDTVYLRLDQALTIQDLPAFLEAAFGVDGEGNITISNDYSTDDIEGADLHLSGADTLIGVETIGLWFSDYSDALLVRIVSSQSSYTTINQATSAPLVGSDTSIIYVQDTGTIDKDDGNSGLIDFSGEGVAAKVVLIFAAGDDGATLDLAMNGAGTLSIYGTRDYTLTGSSGADTIFDFTSTAIASTVNAGDGNDNIYVIGNNNIVTINGGSGDDVIVGGTADKLYGGAGADTVVALHGSAYLSGGAGNDNLVNAYLGSATSNDMVTMVGGSGTDKFMLLAADRTNGSIIGDDGTNNMNTFISDLASGDTINLSALFGSVNDVDGNLAKSSFSLANGVSRDALGTRLDIGGIGADVSSDTANNAESAELGATSYIRVGGATLSKTSDALIFNTTNLSFDSLVGNEIGDLYPIS